MISPVLGPNTMAHTMKSTELRLSPQLPVLGAPASIIRVGAFSLLGSGPFSYLYSPECLEGVFSEVEMQNRA
jgi:hypothetical protein